MGDSKRSRSESEPKPSSTKKVGRRRLRSEGGAAKADKKKGSVLNLLQQTLKKRTPSYDVEQEENTSDSIIAAQKYLEEEIEKIKASLHRLSQSEGTKDEEKTVIIRLLGASITDCKDMNLIHKELIQQYLFDIYLEQLKSELLENSLSELLSELLEQLKSESQQSEPLELPYAEKLKSNKEREIEKRQDDEGIDFYTKEQQEEARKFVTEVEKAYFEKQGYLNEQGRIYVDNTTHTPVAFADVTTDLKGTSTYKKARLLCCCIPFTSTQEAETWSIPSTKTVTTGNEAVIPLHNPNTPTTAL